jgi:Raf kinase inhibitor-like YbhB/YbcL family protein
MNDRGAGMHLRTPAFGDHDLMPDRYARTGDELPPPLEWSQPPDGTVELALLCEDIDAASGPFAHWVVAGLPPTSRGLDADTPPGAIVGRNDYGEKGWGGPHPPAGERHRYLFRLLALDQHPTLPLNPTASDIRAAATGHTIASGTLVGLFAR